MESRKMVLMNLFAGQQWRHKENRLLNTGGGGEQGEGATNGESSMETYTAICKKDSQWDLAVWLKRTQMGAL